MRRPDPQSKRDELLARQMAEQCFAGQLRLITRTVLAAYDDALRPFALTAGRLSLLVELGVEGPRSVDDLREALHMESPDIATHLESLRARGCVAIQRAEPEPGRSLCITDAGRALLRSVYLPWRIAQERAERLLGLRDGNAIHRMARTIRESPLASLPPARPQFGF